MKNAINAILSSFDAKLVRKSTHDRLIFQSKELRLRGLPTMVESEYLPSFFEFLPESKSQLGQDLFVLSELEFKRSGFFVEFGATNGIELSNTYLLEKSLGWDGILAEPARFWHSALMGNRSAKIETDCVWSASGETLVFNEVGEKDETATLSTLDAYSGADNHRSSRKRGKKYEVETISLNDLLKKHNAPKEIDYLSIDTEGSEYEILKAFDFDEFDIKIITCEHNYTAAREKIFHLLSSNGYVRKYSELSAFDDWYVRQ